MSAQRPRRPLTVLWNGSDLVVGGALRDWVRHLGATSTALVSTSLLLLLAGIVALLCLGLRGVAEEQVQSADVLHVYLRSGATDTQLDRLRTTLQRDPDVRRVGYTSPAEALREARARPGLGGLAHAAGQNPFPASFDVTVRQLSDLGPVAARAARSPAVDPYLPTSYNENSYRRVTGWLLGLAVGGGAFLLLLAIIAVAVTQNSVRAAIYARREEVRVMQLVGARRWMIRAPFLLEGALTGSLAGLAAAVIILLGGNVALREAASQTQQLAPGVGPATVLLTAAALLVAGIVLGAGSSALAVRRHLER